MATLAAQQVSLAGLNATQNAAAGGGDDFLNNGNIILRVNNGDVSPTTVTITTPAKVHGVAIDDPAITVPAGEFRFIGPFPPALFNNSTGKVALAYTNVTSVTVEVLEI